MTRDTGGYLTAIITVFFGVANNVGAKRSHSKKTGEWVFVGVFVLKKVTRVALLESAERGESNDITIIICCLSNISSREHNVTLTISDEFT